LILNEKNLIAIYETENSLGLCHVLTVACPKPKPELWDLSSTMQDQWEIDRSEVRLDKKLGSGNFGEVWLGNENHQNMAQFALSNTLTQVCGRISQWL
jgi:hypothetical protein